MAKAEAVRKQAIDGTRLNAFGVDPKDLVVVGLDTKDGVEHPLYDKRVFLPLEESMVLNIMVYGVLEPVLVRKDGNAVEVVAGRRRVLHAREANKRLKKEGSEEIRVPVMVRKGPDATLMGVAISENEVRRDDNPSTKAEKLGRYLATGRTEQEASVAFGVSIQTIKNWSKMLDLDPKVLKAVDSGALSASAAWGLAELSREEQKAELEKLLANGHSHSNGKVTGKNVAKAVKARKRGDGEEGHEPPGKRLVTRVLKLNRSADTLNGDFLKGVMWVLGDIGPSSISGLSALIREAQGGAEE